MEVLRRTLTRSSLVVLFFVVLTLGAFLCTRNLDFSAVLMDRNSPSDPISSTKNLHTLPSTTMEDQKKPPATIDIPLNCSLQTPQTCPANYYPSKIPIIHDDQSSTPSPTCPDYFRWIHEDLWPWRETGITQKMVMDAGPTANFRLIIVNGRAYVETYIKSFQTRDTFTIWGILQLLRKYPGQVPDLDLMFGCDDRPVIMKQDYSGMGSPAPPPLFRYCGDNSTHDIVFPDWSFWGWPESNIKPWNELSKDLQEGNRRIKWVDRQPYAYWKGNPTVAETRMDLMKCNVSDKQDWNARLYDQDWDQEREEGFKNSDLASQCIHRYKIYIEGFAWSVSEKYILACNSPTLLMESTFYDFFTRGLLPLKHYWPAKSDDKCRSIKHAVDWGNGHQEEAQAIGTAGSNFIFDELKMDHVYDYMFHLLSAYAKLLRYKPKVPEKAVEMCSEAMACGAQGLDKKFMVETLVKGLSGGMKPCNMPPPYDPVSLRMVVERKEKGMDQVEAWEKEY